MEGSRHWPSASDAGWTLPDADVMEGSRGCPWPSGLPKPFVPGDIAALVQRFLHEPPPASHGDSSEPPDAGSDPESLSR